jgi:hypothetical protein
VALSSDPDHVEILRRGPRAWNAWREENPTTVPELAGIALKLSERQMGPANGGPINLKAARLQDAFLRFATLSAGNLEAADMSGADLVHARFDDADLSAANLSNAKLDHADFSGANLRNVNLSGASLCHAKNLTQAQLEESKGSNSTILPPDLQGFVSWSARNQAKTTASPKPCDLEPEGRPAADRPEISSHKRPVWLTGVLLIGGALVLTGFVWRYMNDAARPMSDAQSESKPPVTEQTPSLNSEEQKLQPSLHQAVLEKTLEPERQPAEVAIPPMPSSASTAKPAEERAEQGPVPGTDDGAVVPQETAAIPQAPDANRSEETSGPDEQAPNPAATSLPTEASDPSVPISVGQAFVTYRYGTHATVPDAAPDAPDISGTAASTIESQHSAAPDSAADAAIADTPSDSTTEAPVQQLGLSTPAVPPPVSVAEAPAQQLELGTPAAPSLNDAATPAPNPAVPSGEKAAQLPQDADSVPLPVRKPVFETSVAINPEPEISPKPERSSVAHRERSRLAKRPSSPRSRSRVCVPILGQHFEGQCSN